jgi:hypothetical protein
VVHQGQNEAFGVAQHCKFGAPFVKDFKTKTGSEEGLQIQNIPGSEIGVVQRGHRDLLREEIPSRGLPKRTRDRGQCQGTATIAVGQNPATSRADLTAEGNPQRAVLTNPALRFSASTEMNAPYRPSQLFSSTFFFNETVLH